MPHAHFTVKLNGPVGQLPVWTHPSALRQSAVLLKLHLLSLVGMI
jgi:hypothetical protein